MHGDDYCSTGERADLDWFQKSLGEEYSIKTQRVRAGEVEEGQVLNRVFRVSDKGWELEADLRHAELIVEMLDLTEAVGVTTAGAADAKEEEESEELAPGQTTQFRAIGARCNYIAPDRPEIQYAVNEVCRMMSKPTYRSWEKLRRIGKFLKMHPRLIWKYDWQSAQNILDIHSDANWAGCHSTRKSTSGGTASIGSHYIKTWAKTQATIAKSSAESELYGVVRASIEGLGMSALLMDFGEFDF